jgi:hypothetical protein
MTRVVEEVAGVWFRNQPVHCGEDILAGWEEWTSRVPSSMLEYKPSLSETDIMLYRNVSEKGCTHYTYVLRSSRIMT